MKQNKVLKCIFLFALLCIVAGGIFIGVGFAKGGSGEYLSVNKNTSTWWPFDAEIGITIKEKTNMTKVISSDSISLQQVDIMEIDASVVEVEVKAGNENKVTFVNLNDDEKSVSYKDGKTKISTKCKRSNADASVIIEVKVDDISKLEIDNQVGNVLISDLNLNHLEADCETGNITLDNVYAKVLELECQTGNITLKELKSDTADIKVEAGNLKAAGELKGRSEIQVDLGSLDLSLQGTKENYGYELRVDAGSATIDGTKYNGSVEIQERTSASNFLDVKVDMGNAQINFNS